MPQLNDWEVTLSMIQFFERVLSTHKRVASFSREDDIFFRIARGGGFSRVSALLVNRYTIGVADIIRAQNEFPEMTCIVASGNWCGYTPEAKAHGRQNAVGVFTTGEMNGALASRDVNGYARKDAKGRPHYEYRNA